jgi:cell division septation protein DedD
MLHARYLEACARVWKSGESEALIWLANNPEYAALRPAIYYTLWKALESEAAANWKNRLLAEFPRSPEARIAATEDGRAAASATVNTTVSAASSPMWLLLPEYSGFVPGPLPSVAPSAPAVSPAQTPAASVTVSPPASPVPSAPAVSPPAPGARVLQTGLFSTEANARTQIEQLRQAGFSAAMSRRIVNGAERWVVTVPPGADINRTIRELKSAGFDSFPVNAQ